MIQRRRLFVRNVGGQFAGVQKEGEDESPPESGTNGDIKSLLLAGTKRYR